HPSSVFVRDTYTYFARTVLLLVGILEISGPCRRSFSELTGIFQNSFQKGHRS
ncbi:hypothetical protein FRX31_017138, partial [Thalictrum thalictroides]